MADFVIYTADVKYLECTREEWRTENGLISLYRIDKDRIFSHWDRNTSVMKSFNIPLSEQAYLVEKNKWNERAPTI